MDHSDIEILKLLQKNARITVSEISNKVNISISAVSERVKKLESSGIIEQYTAITNAKLLKKNLTAIMFVSLERPRFTDRFVEFVKGEDEILEC